MTEIYMLTRQGRKDDRSQTLLVTSDLGKMTDRLKKEAQLMFQVR